jgi:hypothetical protein
LRNYLGARELSGKLENFQSAAGGFIGSLPLLAGAGQ